MGFLPTNFQRGRDEPLRRRMGGGKIYEPLRRRVGGDKICEFGLGRMIFLPPFSSLIHSSVVAYIVAATPPQILF